MITPLLEKLILDGKASYSTTVIGGSQKCILNVPKDRFIIITDLFYNYAVKGRDSVLTQTEVLALSTKWNTQLKIFSTKSENTFLFRENLRLETFQGTLKYVLPCGGIALNTFLVHDSDISFTFSNAGRLLQDLPPLVTLAQSIAHPPPRDYGKQGQTGAINVRKNVKVVVSSTGNDRINTAGTLETVRSLETPLSVPNALIFPVDTLNDYGSTTDVLNNAQGYPALNVGYVTVFGTPHDLQSS